MFIWLCGRQRKLNVAVDIVLLEKLDTVELFNQECGR